MQIFSRNWENDKWSILLMSRPTQVEEEIMFCFRCIDLRMNNPWTLNDKVHNKGFIGVRQSNLSSDKKPKLVSLFDLIYIGIKSIDSNNYNLKDCDLRYNSRSEELKALMNRKSILIHNRREVRGSCWDFHLLKNKTHQIKNSVKSQKEKHSQDDR